MGLEASQTQDPLDQAPQAARKLIRGGNGGDLLSMLYSLNL